MKVNFISPTSHTVAYYGGCKANITFTPFQIPRNAILVRPDNDQVSKALYDLLVFCWENRVFEYFSHGSCQQSIRSRDVKELLHGRITSTRFTWPNVDSVARLFRDRPVPCIVKTIDTKQYDLLSGDILLGRIGSKHSIARPYLIKEVA